VTVVAGWFAVVVSAAGSAVAHVHPRKLDPPPPPMATSVASWYADSGPGACGYGAQLGLRFASLFLPCGARVEFCYAGCAVGEMADHGPYVAGRTFDLNVNLRDAISCTDLCPVRWRRLP
jgi:hypothetical protein